MTLEYLILYRLAEELKARDITAEDICNIVIVNPDGMRDQLKTLAKQEKNIIYNLIQYMHNKMFNASKECKEIFISALSNYLKDCTNIKLYGCLVRDTNPNPQDLSSSAKNLYPHIKGLTQAEFVAIYTGSKMQDEHWINIVKEVSNASKQ